MRRDKIWMILAAACLAVTVTACGGQKESTTEASWRSDGGAARDKSERNGIRDSCGRIPGGECHKYIHIGTGL